MRQRMNLERVPIPQERDTLQTKNARWYFENVANNANFSERNSFVSERTATCIIPRRDAIPDCAPTRRDGLRAGGPGDGGPPLQEAGFNCKVTRVGRDGPAGNEPDGAGGSGRSGWVSCAGRARYP